MKRIISIVMVMVVLLGLSVTAFAAEGDFVPSINEKSAPTIKSITVTTASGTWVCTQHDIDKCILVTPVSEIKEEDRLLESTKQALIDVYNKILNAAKLSDIFTNIDGVDKMVVRDLFDVSSICDALNEVFPKEGTSIAITFDLGIDADTNVVCASLINGSWGTHSVKNNGDGTVTVDFTHFCPVAFLVSNSEVGNNPGTGDAQQLEIWIATLAVSLAAIIVLVVIVLRKRKTEK
ncbi:MAG: hypothetical protein IJ408_04715 [Clostridia bacterium]|nr:hypothetical protein [Clostridia bacterium]